MTHRRNHLFTMANLFKTFRVFACLLLLSHVDAAEYNRNLANLDYRIYPRRTQEEAAVLEWGYSAIISALDASVAEFGPQVADAALLEVETRPVRAVPINGIRKSNDEKPKLGPLDNADEIRGQMCVMTNTGGLTGVEMAKVAQMSGAAALLVVNVDNERPDDIYRLPAEEGAEEIDIPVVMISLNSASILTTETVTPDTKKSEIVNNGMPDRVRLYAGGDRPFFEDVEASNPTIYLIHNLLTAKECDSLIKQAEPRFAPIEKNDALQLTQDPDKYHNVERVMLWQGMIQTPSRKEIEDRIEQVTGFPASHYSDFIVDRLEKGSHWKPRHDTFPEGSPMASIVVFLSDDSEGGEIVYPSTDGEPVKIKPRKGMAVVHHNINERQQFDINALRALLPVSSGPFYVCSKYIFPEPISNARRIALPIFAAPFGGKLPSPVIKFYDLMVERFGFQQGGMYFNKLCVFLPLLLLFGAAQFIVDRVQQRMKSSRGKKKKE